MANQRKDYKSDKAPNRKGKGNKTNRRNNSNNRDKDVRKDTRGEYTSRSNDPGWYAKDPQLLRDAASLSFYNPVGQLIDWYGNPIPTGSHLDIANTPRFSVPGIEQIDIDLVPGINSDGTSPLNIAIHQIFQDVRHVNSGHSNYDPADFGIYLLAVDSLYAFYSWMVRIYGTLMMYTQINNYYPLYLLEMQGLNSGDFVAHMADFRAFLNQWILRLATIYVPAAFDIYKRHAWMFMGYYKDDASLKGQTMYFHLNGFYKYSASESPHGGKLTYYENDCATFDDVRTMANELIEAIIADEDMGIMGGDILKCYEMSGLYKVSLVPENFIINPVYDEEVLYQMRHIVYPTAGYSVSDVTQTNGTLRNNVTFERSRPISPWKRVLNFWDDAYCSPEHIIVATRLMPTYQFTSVDWGQNDDDPTESGKVVSCGTELVERVHFGRFVDYGTGKRFDVVPMQMFLLDSDIDNAAMLDVVSWSNFRYGPMIYMCGISDQETLAAYGVLGDLANYTTISNLELEKMHTCALMGEFNVPLRGMA